MSRFDQDFRDGLTQTLKARIERYAQFANSPDPSLRTPHRLARLMEHVRESQTALDAHVAQWGPDGTGPVAPVFGMFMIYGDDKEQIFIDDGRPLTIDDISKHYAIVEAKTDE